MHLFKTLNRSYILDAFPKAKYAFKGPIKDVPTAAPNPMFANESERVYSLSYKAASLTYKGSTAALPIIEYAAVSLTLSKSST